MFSYHKVIVYKFKMGVGILKIRVIIKINNYVTLTLLIASLSIIGLQKDTQLMLPYLVGGLVVTLIVVSTLFNDKIDRYSPYIVPSVIELYALFMMYMIGYSVIMLLAFL